MLETREQASFGVVEMRGFDLADESEAQASELRSALALHAVLCLRIPRALDEGEFFSLARRFGSIKDPVARAKDGRAFRYDRMRQIIDSGAVREDARPLASSEPSFGGLDERRPGLFETWHCDDTYTEEPALATFLHARQLPPSGGGPTHFLDMRAAYRLLDESTRERLSGLRVRYAYNNEDAFPTRRSAHGPADVLVEASHPLVRTHPFAGTRALFLDLDRAKYIEALPLVEGRALLQSLQDHAEAKAPRCEHAWRAHDVLVWDNASVQHKAGGNFKLGESRRFWRCMIAGERPV